MRSYLSLTAINLKLALRERIAIFFNYVFPLIFFFAFGQLMHAGQGGGEMVQIVTMVLVIGVLGNGLFGGGIRAVQDREQNILRRFKVAPISPAPMLVASMATGWALYVPALFLIFGLANLVYGMAVPARWFSLFVIVSVGVVAFRAIGLIIASVANSAQESQILVQLVYIPMLFLTGATFSLTMLPAWAQKAAQFLPATYLVSGLQGILVRNESLAENWPAVAALLLTTVLATFISTKLFRWEKDEKIAATAKLWLLAAVFPFLLLGSYQMYRGEQVTKTRSLHREMARSRNLLIRGARIFTGDGRIIGSGAVLVRQGKIAEIYDGPGPGNVNAEVIEAAGKTVLPGLIDVSVNLGASGGLDRAAGSSPDPQAMARRLAADLYSGVTAVRSAGEPLEASLRARSLVNSGQWLGAELFACGPVFTVPGGGEAGQAVQTPQTAEEARRDIDAMKRAGVDGIEASLVSGAPEPELDRAGVILLRTVSAEACAVNLPVVASTGDSRGVAEALAAGVTGIERGSVHDRIPDQLLAEMAGAQVAYVPNLSIAEARLNAESGNAAALNRSLVEQVAPPALLQRTRAILAARQPSADRINALTGELNQARDNLLRAYRAGVPLAAGSGAGDPLVFHGAALHRELQLWVEAGIPPQAVLEAATRNAARLLRADGRIGLIRKGYDADLLVVDGNPLEDIAATERISIVIFKGERIDRSELFEQE